jgi:cytochrome b involved in lipid metabolism
MRLSRFFTPALGSFMLVVGTALAAQLQPRLLFDEHFAVSSSIQTSPPSPTPTVIATVAAQKVPTPSKQPAKSPTKTPAKPVKVTCIITVNGKRYDVQSLRKTHSGGNIFLCGTDMTKTFNQQHGTNYTLIAKYRI